MSVSPAEDRLSTLLGYLEADPNNAALLTDAAEAALDARDPATAAGLLERAASLTPLTPQQANLAGLAALQTSAYGRASEIFTGLLEAGVDDPGLRFNLAWARASLCEFETALADLDEDTARVLPQAAMLRVQLLHQFGNVDAAIDCARTYFVLHPDHEGLMAAISVVAIDAEDEGLAAEAAARAGDHPDALATRGTLALGDQRATEAEAIFERALERNAATPRAWIGLGLAKLLTGKQTEAPGDIDRGAEMFGDHLGSWVAAGWAHFLAGNWNTARARFETALALDPTFAESQGSLAVVDLLEGKIEDAQRRSDVALRLDRHSYSAALAKSLIAAGSGRPEEARRIFDLALLTPIDDSGRTIAQALAGMGLRSH